jgi:hypothetical protein
MSWGSAQTEVHVPMVIATPRPQVDRRIMVATIPTATWQNQPNHDRLQTRLFAVTNAVRKMLLDTNHASLHEVHTRLRDIVESKDTDDIIVTHDDVFYGRANNTARDKLAYYLMHTDQQNSHIRHPAIALVQLIQLLALQHHNQATFGKGELGCCKYRVDTGEPDVDDVSAKVYKDPLQVVTNAWSTQYPPPGNPFSREEVDAHKKKESSWAAFQKEIIDIGAPKMNELPYCGAILRGEGAPKMNGSEFRLNRVTNLRTEILGANGGIRKMKFNDFQTHTISSTRSPIPLSQLIGKRNNGDGGFWDFRG